jgi:hypothetical protein
LKEKLHLKEKSHLKNLKVNLTGETLRRLTSQTS